MFLGIDGGGSKTAFALVDADGQLRALHEEGGVYHIETGMDTVAATLKRGCETVLARAGIHPADLGFAFFGLPAYGEDRVAQAALDAMPQAILGHGRYMCGNDMVCSWAGSLACNDGISVIAGTGSMAYGEAGGRSARAGGWGELFSDEGSAYWIAQAGLTLFSRMSDGRAARGPLYDLVRERLALDEDIDLCARIYGAMGAERSRVAQLSRLVSEAALAGDRAAQGIFDRAAEELAQMVDAVRSQLQVAPDTALAVSFSGGLFGADGPLRRPFEQALASRPLAYRVTPPVLTPVLGAALYAARSAGTPLGPVAVARLARQPLA